MIKSAANNNKWALISFSVVLAVFLIIVDVFMVIEEREYLLREDLRHANSQLDMMANLLTEPMIRNDYVAVEEYVPRWASDQSHVAGISVIAPNGFIVVEYKNEAIRGRLRQLKKEVSYRSRPLFTLSVDRDVSNIDTHIRHRTATLLLVSVIVVVLLGWLLWQVLKRTAIAPLEKEIQERMQVEKDLALYVEELESYSYSIAHDLRAPVRSITSFSQLVMDDAVDKLNDTEKQDLQRVITAGKFMAELIDDILALARITRESMNVERLDLSAMAHASINLLRHLHPQRQVAVDIQPNLGAVGDVNLVQLLVTNLLENAWKYTGKRDDAHIEFGSKVLNGYQCFYVRDNGVGFDEQFAGKLFKPFQRLHGKEFTGTGIGLATVQRIVKRHDGKVWAESVINEGATFYFYLSPE